MEFYQDWKFWLFTITIIGIIINWLTNHKLMNNDLKHLEIDVGKIKKDNGIILENIKCLAVDIAYIKGKTETKKRSYKKSKV